MRKPEASRGRGESAITEVFFVVGAFVVVVGFILSLRMSWPSFDPLALAMLVGVGLLLIVVCERLRLAIAELQRITAALGRIERLAASPADEPEVATNRAAPPVEPAGSTGRARPIR